MAIETCTRTLHVALMSAPTRSSSSTISCSPQYAAAIRGVQPSCVATAAAVAAATVTAVAAVAAAGATGGGGGGGHGGGGGEPSDQALGQKADRAQTTTRFSPTASFSGPVCACRIVTGACRSRRRQRARARRVAAGSRAAHRIAQIAVAGLVLQQFLNKLVLALVNGHEDRRAVVFFLSHGGGDFSVRHVRLLLIRLRPYVTIVTAAASVTGARSVRLNCVARV
eukprot:366399-Chlamydomonas_euryale.AAC.52